MNKKTKEKIQYRFSGYQMPKIKLDETGDAYIVLEPHPYYYNQPLYWQKPCWKGSLPNMIPQKCDQKKIKNELHSFLPFENK